MSQDFATTAAGRAKDAAAEAPGQAREAAGQAQPSTLLRQELNLVKAELKQQAFRSGKPAAMYGGAAFAGYMVLLFASIAAWWGLSQVVNGAVAALIVMVIWAIIGAVLYIGGRRQWREIHPPSPLRS